MFDDMTLRQRAETLEAFETDGWAAAAILRHELLTPIVIDPNCGTGVLTNVARAEGYTVHTADIYDWSKHLPCEAPQHIGDWTNRMEPWPFRIKGKFSVFMNPPFKLACEFVDRALELDAYKILCFQRWAWVESVERDEWWQKNPPARIWRCRERASCYRFDIPATCPEPDDCPNLMAKKRPREDISCRECLSGSTQAHAWFVWERGHKGAEVPNVLRRNGRR